MSNTPVEKTLRLANAEQIKTALVKEAEKRGLTKGAILNNSNIIVGGGSRTLLENTGGWKYNFNDDTLSYDNGQSMVYRKGKWAVLKTEGVQPATTTIPTTTTSTTGTSPQDLVGKTFITNKGKTVRIEELVRKNKKSIKFAGRELTSTNEPIGLQITYNIGAGVIEKLLKGEKIKGYYILEAQAGYVAPKSITAPVVEPTATIATNKGNRPSPTESATNYAEYSVLLGNDGNYYEVRLDKNGRKSWKRKK
jgi:hypothetical protein